MKISLKTMLKVILLLVVLMTTNLKGSAQGTLKTQEIDNILKEQETDSGLIIHKDINK